MGKNELTAEVIEGVQEGCRKPHSIDFTVGLKVDLGCCRSLTSMPSAELSPTSPMMSHGPMTPGRSLHGSLNDLPALAEAAEGGGSNAASNASSPEKMKKTVVAVNVDRA